MKAKFANCNTRVRQQRWNSEEMIGQLEWIIQLTYVLLLEIKSLLSCFTDITFYSCMALSGHDSFGSYVHKIGKRETAACPDCGTKNTLDYAVFACPVDLRCRLQEVLQTLNNFTSSEWSVPSFAAVMFRSADHTNMILQYLHDIMQRRFSVKQETAAFTKRDQYQCHQGGFRLGDHC